MRWASPRQDSSAASSPAATASQVARFSQAPADSRSLSVAAADRVSARLVLSLAYMSPKPPSYFLMFLNEIVLSSG
jgi:hypothetical protein